MSLKSKCIMGTYLLFQIASHLLRMVPTVLVSLGHQPALSPLNAAFLLLLPIGVNWCFLSMLMSDRIKTLPDKISHLVK